jgi:hypothetical protein
MNLYNVSGESIKCYVCTSMMNNKCADPIDRSGLEPTECSTFVAKEAASVVGKGVNVLRNIFGKPELPQGSDLKFACVKVGFSGKKFQNLVISETFCRI